MSCDKSCSTRLFDAYTNSYSFYLNKRGWIYIFMMTHMIVTEIFCKYPKWFSNVTSCQLSSLTSTITETFFFWCVRCSERTWVLSQEKRRRRKNLSGEKQQSSKMKSACMLPKFVYDHMKSIQSHWRWIPLKMFSNLIHKEKKF